MPSDDIEQATIADHDHDVYVADREVDDGVEYELKKCRDEDCGWWRKSKVNEQADLAGWSE